MKFTDYIAKRLEFAGVDFVAGVTGGGVVHLLHSMENLETVEVIYTHHEQAAAYAAEAYARMNKKSACFVTTGPGGTNAITGLASAWLDSIPVIFISGQARSSALTGPGTVRQIGSQHFDIIPVVESITKYARTIRGLDEAELIIDEALSAAFSGRPGPVWIDIPLDFQEMEIEPSFMFESPQKNYNTSRNLSPNIELYELFQSLMAAKRPILIIGYGARLSNTYAEIIGAAIGASIPMVFTWNTLDMLPSQHELNLGLVGVNGMRSANLAIAAADCVIALGSHLSLQITGVELTNFAPKAEIFSVDIDMAEIQHMNSRIRGICLNLTEIVGDFVHILSSLPTSPSWISKVNELKKYKNYGLDLEPRRNQNPVNQYYFYKEISKFINPGDSLVIDGGGNVLFSSHQQLELPAGVRLITGHGLGCMGSGLPQAVGAAFATEKPGKTFCFIGDGSMQFNIQELATIRFHNLAVTVIVINNGGYLAIINTQDTFFDRRFGVDQDTGLFFPSYEIISDAYEIPYFAVRSDDNLIEILESVALVKGPSLVEIFVDKNTPLLPRVGYKISNDGKRTRSAIYDMDPALDSSTLLNLIEL